jgi:membrane-bound metal-dependent hydrolase YbcI (DUF457 family)
MFIGHLAFGFAAKRIVPQVSLGTLFIACQFADLLWPLLVLLGVEAVAIDPGNTAVTPLDFIRYPYSHSFSALALWAAVLAIAYKALRRSSTIAAAVVAALVLSHWFLDALTHRPDLPLTIGGARRVGAGLWYSVSATLVVELALFAVGVALYAAATRPRDRTGTLAFGALAVFLVAVYLVNIFGPPPPSATAVAWGAQAVWLLVAWAWWTDRHRMPVTTWRFRQARR